MLAEVFGDFCVSVAGEVDEAPGFVDFEKVDFAGASRGFGNAGEAVLVGKEVDEGRFSDIGAADEGKLGKFALGAIVELDGAFDEFGGSDLTCVRINGGRGNGDAMIC